METSYEKGIMEKKRVLHSTNPKGSKAMQAARLHLPNLQVTAALIVAGDRLFVGQRPPGKKFALQWEFPGGKVESGETLKESLVREIKEELCWGVTVGSLFQHLRHSYSDFTIDLFAYWCTVTRGKLCLREHVAYRWASLEDLHKFDFTTADRQLIEHLQRIEKLP
ncbi:(deoxy)nucleoside triphosphate pyrophosphohydrolase [Desulfoferrobacter suflitae]|uniref:(deoxy)nucleoside triphosphate pyrophosphohydrolase n=1 Tax=Desulfoferrobacter suflitae TaxID=2865782 RepID=UPI002164A951|nr:(deoxy)nucleoside triphosphate pyrophosphohydrolase [Desulfoferrobacter suflitae]MCK8604313.1 (deoxy)nucleoside triphosphate pyrophosphohydrolase [Desulfoferrobacter suflitae]